MGPHHPRGGRSRAAITKTHFRHPCHLEDVMHRQNEGWRGWRTDCRITNSHSKLRTGTVCDVARSPKPAEALQSHVIYSTVCSAFVARFFPFRTKRDVANPSRVDVGPKKLPTAVVGDEGPRPSNEVVQHLHRAYALKQHHNEQCRAA